MTSEADANAASHRRTSLPPLVLVDQEGSVRKRWIGALPNKSEQIRLLVDALLDEQGRSCEVSDSRQNGDPRADRDSAADAEIGDEVAGTL